jgi:hypothetical protein
MSCCSICLLPPSNTLDLTLPPRLVDRRFPQQLLDELTQLTMAHPTYAPAPVTRQPYPPQPNLPFHPPPAFAPPPPSQRGGPPSLPGGDFSWGMGGRRERDQGRGDQGRGDQGRGDMRGMMRSSASSSSSSSSAPHSGNGNSSSMGSGTFGRLEATGLPRHLDSVLYDLYSEKPFTACRTCGVRIAPVCQAPHDKRHADSATYCRKEHGRRSWFLEGSAWSSASLFTLTAVGYPLPGWDPKSYLTRQIVLPFSEGEASGETRNENGNGNVSMSMSMTSQRNANANVSAASSAAFKGSAAPGGTKVAFDPEREHCVVCGDKLETVFDEEADEPVYVNVLEQSDGALVHHHCISNQPAQKRMRLE